MQTGSGVRSVIMAVGRPGHRLFHKGKCGENVGFQGIESQRHGTGAVKTAQIIIIFIAQLVFQAGEKSFGEHIVVPFRCRGDPLGARGRAKHAPTVVFSIIEKRCRVVKAVRMW
jgi:hypothetical protein